MLTPKLPFEILSRIANLMNSCDRIAGSITCKAWQAPFEEVLWGTIDIYNQQRLDFVCKTPREANKIYPYRGSYARELNLWGFKLGDQEIFLMLQQIFPNLRRLNINENCLDDMNIGKISNWNLWGSLQKLNVDLSKAMNTNLKNDFLKILKDLPYLEHLESYFGEKRISITFELEDFEAMHSDLKQLEELIIGAVLLPLSSDDVARISTLEQRPKVKKLTVYSTLKDSRWLCYFGHKYPNLDTLVWINVDNIQALDLHQEETISILKTFPPVFQNLGEIGVRTTGTTLQHHLIYWNIFSQFHTPVKEVSHTFSSPTSSARLAQDIVQSLTQAFSSTIEILFLKRNEKGNRLQEIANAIVECPRLVDFSVHIIGVVIFVKIVLQKFPALKRIEVNNGIMAHSGQKSAEPLNHGLRMVKMSKGTLMVSSLSYLSFNCNRLKYVSLDDMVIFGPMDEESGKVEVDMSWSNLHLLRLHATRFQASRATFNRKTVINLMEIREKRLFYQDDKRNTEEEEEEYLEPDSIWSNWYHIYGDLNNQTKTWNMRQLNEDEFNEVIYFFDNHVNDENLDTQDNRTRNGLVQMDEWRRDLYRGGFSWTVESLNSIICEPMSSTDLCTWNYLYRNL
ncbi:hypothetical protein CLU79DRAFT_757159, partial [Phycomyces nitens]